MNIKDADLIQLWRKSDGTFWYINGFGTWTQFVTGGGSDCCTEGTPYIGLEPDDAMPSGGVGRVNFGITTTGLLQTRTEAGVQQYFAPTGNSVLYKSILNVTYNTATSGLLVIGEVYCILTLEAGDDFTNVGYLNEGLVFTATGTTPTVWSNGTTIFNITRSTVTNYVLTGVNNLQSIAWTLTNVGVLEGRKNGAFTLNKTFLLCGSVTDDYSPTLGRISEDLIFVKAQASGLPSVADIFELSIQAEVFA